MIHLREGFAPKVCRCYKTLKSQSVISTQHAPAGFVWQAQGEIFVLRVKTVKIFQNIDFAEGILLGLSRQPSVRLTICCEW
jgi:uncharacterized membrane protein